MHGHAGNIRIHSNVRNINNIGLHPCGSWAIPWHVYGPYVHNMGMTNSLWEVRLYSSGPLCLTFLEEEKSKPDNQVRGSAAAAVTMSKGYMARLSMAGTSGIRKYRTLDSPAGEVESSIEEHVMITSRWWGVVTVCASFLYTCFLEDEVHPYRLGKLS